MTDSHTSPSEIATKVASSQNASDVDAHAISESITAESFDDWYREHTFAQNLRDGKPWRNTVSPVTEPEVHYPHQLNQCQRKIYYQRQNAPEESADPHGIFWIGTQIEEDIILPYLESLIPSELYIGNSFWVSYEICVDGTELTIRGSTDPLVVDEQNVPRLLMEVKTRSSISDLEKPLKRHKAQLHAYLYGLSQEYEETLTEGVLIYVQRKTFEVRAFSTPFDVDFWCETVLEWMTTQTKQLNDEQLPPGKPEYQGECRYCSYRNRCGRGEAEHKDLDAIGFLPLYPEYTRSKVKDHLEARGDEGAKLTPSLAHQFPSLAKQYAVHDWRCTCCGTHHNWNTVDWDGDVENPPLCPECRGRGIPAPLEEPIPSTQPVKGGS